MPGEKDPSDPPWDLLGHAEWAFTASAHVVSPPLILALTSEHSSRPSFTRMCRAEAKRRS